jgi:hypothetical protein
LASEAAAARAIGRRATPAPALPTVVLHSNLAPSQGEPAYVLISDQVVTLRLAPGSELLDAIVSRDAVAAESVMRRHVSGFEQAIRKVL